MLKHLARPRIVSPIAPRTLGHEALFMERYALLMAGARRLTGDADRAEELVHNAFVQFVLSSPDLASIKDVDGYLLIMLRNMNISQARRTALMPTETLSAAEYDSAEAGLLALDAYAQLQVREQLSLICDYGCRRKVRSKIGSALILRFFHGYYPAEVAQVMRSNREVADKWLSRARQEAQAYVENPSSLKLLADQSDTRASTAHMGGSTNEFLNELRSRVFAAQSGRCLSHRKLHELYQSPETDTADTEYASHLVSCARCLDEVNGLLDLPSLADRFPMEAFGNDPRPPRGSGGGGGGSMSGGELDKLKQVSRRRVRDVLAHRPKELRVAVNGYVLGSQSLSSDANKLALTVNTPERIGFVEVFSEQGFCLLFSNVDAPPDGALEQKTHVELSEGRALDLSLDFSGPWPTVNLFYNDPSFGPVEAQQLGDQTIQPKSLIETSIVGEASQSDTIHSIKRAVLPLGRRLTDWTFWLRPTTVTALVSVLLVTAAVLLYRQVPNAPMTAAGLLQRAAAAEEADAARVDQVIHRTISLEEKNARGELLTRRKLEIWHSAERGLTARRLYDDRGQLVAGLWRRADGGQTFYHHGTAPKSDLSPGQRTQPALTFENVWQIPPSAKEFTLLIGGPDEIGLEERPTGHLISYQAQPGLSGGLVKASLLLSRVDLHAAEQILFVKQGNEVREYHFVEASLERRAPNTVAPAVFDPEPELLSGAGPDSRISKAENASPLALAPSPVIATAALEVEVIDLLNSAGAFMGEQISVQRTSDGKITVNALVETDKRKAELLNALATAKGNPAININIETVAEAQAREARAKKGKQTTGGVIVDTFTATENTSPVYNDLRKKFDEAGARAFADRVLRRSQQARRHALAAKQLSDRFSQADLASLNATERAKWLGLITGHARQFLAESESIRRELQTIFPDLAGGGASPRVATDKEIQVAVRELYNLSVACDEDLRGSFALLTGAGGSAEVKTAKFWRTLNNAVATARSLQSAK